MRIIAYTFEADVWCPHCTKTRFPKATTPDENGVDCFTKDREENPVRPVFDIDENDFTHCGYCGEPLR